MIGYESAPRAEHDRRRVTGAGVGERALARVVDRRDDGREGVAELALEHRAGRLQRLARRQAGLEVGAQR